MAGVGPVVHYWCAEQRQDIIIYLYTHMLPRTTLRLSIVHKDVRKDTIVIEDVVCSSQIATGVSIYSA